VAISFIGVGNRSIGRKSPTCQYFVTNFIQIMCEKRDRSTPEVSVFGSENSVHGE
jgi:hypothetical protein